MATEYGLNQARNYLLCDTDELRHVQVVVETHVQVGDEDHVIKVKAVEPMLARAGKWN